MTGAIETDGTGGVVVRDLVASNPSFEVRASGRGGGGPVALDLVGHLKDLSRLDDGLVGAVAIDATVSGNRDDVSSKVRIEARNAALHGHRLQGPVVTFAGRGALASHAGKLEIAGAFDDQPISGSSQIVLGGDGGVTVDAVNLTVASATLVGGVRAPAQENPTGKFVVDIPRLADLSALAGMPLQGGAKATIVLGGSADHPALSVSASVPSMRIGDTAVQGLVADVETTDYAKALRIHGKATAKRIDTGGAQLRDLRLVAKDKDGKTDFSIAADVDQAHAEARGTLAQADAVYTLALSRVTLRASDLVAELEAPAKVVIENGVVRFQKLAIAAGGGRAEFVGRAGAEALDLAVVLQRVPASLANTLDRSLGLEGRVDGKIVVSGTTDAPRAEANVTWRGAAAALTRAQLLPPLSLDLHARLAKGAVKGEVGIGGVDGLNVKAVGSVEAISDGRIAVHIEGGLPLTLANAALADRSSDLAGTARLKAEISGTVAAPKVAGEVRLDGAQVSDPASGLTLVGVNGSAHFTETRLDIDRIAGTSPKGGALSVQGALSLAPDGALSTALRLDLNGLKFDDRELVSGEVDGSVTLNGPLQSLQAAGTIHIKRLDVIVPSQMPRSIAELDLQHVHAPKDSYAARHATEAKTDAAPPATITLNLALQAANRIFVRGRGVDAQLGGSLVLRGTAAQPIANGGFEVVRGRLDILGRQLDFKHGKLFFNGSVEPLLDMEAVADADGVTVSVTVTGRASKPTFKFSSVPELPEDEVVARLLFNKSLAKLSPVQLAQLASEVDKIGGLSSGPSAVDQVKGALGVDVLDVSGNDQSSAAVSAGKYVDENTYVGVRQGTSASSSRVIIDHDLTDNLKARGELGADGNSKIGIGVEWDY